MAILAIASPTFQPAMRIISAITNASPATVTTTFDHDYVSGTVVRLHIPTGFGMYQANKLQGEITVTGTTTFTIDIDTTDFDALYTLELVDTTDVSGDAGGTFSTTQGLFKIGQSFTIGNNIFTVIASSGALLVGGGADGTGTFNIATGAYTFTGSDATTSIYFNPVLFPEGQQYATCVPIGDTNVTLQGSVQNVLPN